MSRPKLSAEDRRRSARTHRGFEPPRRGRRHLPAASVIAVPFRPSHVMLAEPTHPCRLERTRSGGCSSSLWPASCWWRCGGTRERCRAGTTRHSSGQCFARRQDCAESLRCTSTFRLRRSILKLPNGSRAIIDRRKLTDYCLNLDHDDGRHKARLFRRLAGLNRHHATLLLDALREAAASGDAVTGKVDRYGRRYVIDFEFAGPGGTTMIRSAWIVRADEDVPRLVTCYIP